MPPHIIEGLGSRKLSEFDRLIPPEGIEIFPQLIYVDVNDVWEDVRKTSKEYFRTDPEYIVAGGFLSFIKKGNDIGKRFCVYVYHGLKYVGNAVFTEYYDSPWKFGKGDFLYTKFIHSDFRRGKYSRWMIADLMCLLFKSGLVQNLYTIIPVKAKADGDFFLDLLDLHRAPCASEIKDTDGPKVQCYAHVRGREHVLHNEYAIVEFNGDEYRKMDLYQYLRTSCPDTHEDIISKWMADMTEAYQKIGEYHGCFNDEHLRDLSVSTALP